MDAGFPAEKARAIRVVLLDVDGTLTDGGLYYLEDGSVALRFDVRDGLGLVLARRAGLVVGIVSARNMPQVRQRAEELGLDEIHLGIGDKLSVVEAILARRGVPRDALCYAGDDLVDLPAMAAAGLPVAVADAVPQVRAAAAWVTTKPGGRGAVRELIDALLEARAADEPDLGPLR